MTGMRVPPKRISSSRTDFELACREDSRLRKSRPGNECPSHSGHSLSPRSREDPPVKRKRAVRRGSTVRSNDPEPIRRSGRRWSSRFRWRHKLESLAVCSRTGKPCVNRPRITHGPSAHRCSTSSSRCLSQGMQSAMPLPLRDHPIRGCPERRPRMLRPDGQSVPAGFPRPPRHGGAPCRGNHGTTDRGVRQRAEQEALLHDVANRPHSHIAQWDQRGVRGRVAHAPGSSGTIIAFPEENAKSVRNPEIDVTLRSFALDFPRPPWSIPLSPCRVLPLGAHLIL